jgi:predicted CxxxxCH...CXXCH cytochrome family protein
MPQVKTARLLFVGFLALTASFIGCSDPNAQSPINSDTGSHAANWLPEAHMTAAVSDMDSCSACHGADFAGGISGVSCTACHLGSTTSVHPANWIPVYSTHGPYVNTNSTNACANRYCHGSSLTGVPDSGPSCTSCHLGSPTSVHPADWVPVYSTHGPYVKTNSTSACANQYCHGLSLTGVANSGPSCTSCHLGGLTSGHPADWVPIYSTHGPYVTANGTNSCSNQYCHGTTLAGVPDSGPSCTLCHLGTPTSVHPTDWIPVYSTHGPYVNASPTGTSACANQYCHGPSLAGVPDSGPSCTSCHMGGVTNIHPAGWMGDACTNHGSYALTNGTTGCANIYCHGATLAGVPQSGPSCRKCHPTIPTSPSCGTCHGIPPNGSAYPDLPGKHSKHLALNGVTCAACHNRSCDQHMNGTVDVIFNAAYNAKSGTGSFNTTAKTCSEVSCHGGPRTQTLAQLQSNQSSTSQTPDWYTGSIAVGSQCQACHIYGTTEYNSYYSGKHFFHLGGRGNIYATCTDCHDTTILSNASRHFPDLGSNVISAGTASATTWWWLNYNGTTCTYAGCHQGETRTWW